MKRILLLHGVNLNMFGKRDSSHYGTSTLSDIDEMMTQLASQLEVELTSYQTNLEGDLCNRVHQAVSDETDAIIINAGAWTHYSYAMADALRIFKGPIVEVHMSNIHAREQFRHHSVIAPIAKGQICGFGVESYLLGLRAAVSAMQGG
jgi:3-dehydroquinate dehydratase-2